MMDFHKFWNSMVSVTPTFITKHDVIIRFLEAEAELTVILSYRISRWIYFEQNVNTARRRFDIVWNKKAGNTKLEYPNKLLKFQNLFFFNKIDWKQVSLHNLLETPSVNAFQTRSKSRMPADIWIGWAWILQPWPIEFKFKCYEYWPEVVSDIGRTRERSTLM